MLLKHNGEQLAFFSKRKTLSYILILIDEHEREETRQLYEELNNNTEVSDMVC